MTQTLKKDLPQQQAVLQSYVNRLSDSPQRIPQHGEVPPNTEAMPII
jgi:hypothetical protein